MPPAPPDWPAPGAPYAPSVMTFVTPLVGWLLAGMAATFCVVWLLKPHLRRDPW